MGLLDDGRPLNQGKSLTIKAGCHDYHVGLMIDALSQLAAQPLGGKGAKGLGRYNLTAMINQACLRPRDRFWDIPVPKIDSAFDNLFVPQPSWSPSTTQQLRKLVAAPYLAPNDWTPRSEAYFVFPLAQGTPGKQCGLAATGDYQPSLRSPWLAANEVVVSSVDGDITVDNCGDYMEALGEQLTDIDLDLLDSFF
ncbi:hypothetical protein, partial [Thiolapillus sp.]|uniref:hypothetical protein n=1 Tax=Thiolapillus sp. TaxID=2017437 RepID=UPI003AF493B3